MAESEEPVIISFKVDTTNVDRVLNDLKTRLDNLVTTSSKTGKHVENISTNFKNVGRDISGLSTNIQEVTGRVSAFSKNWRYLYYDVLRTKNVLVGLFATGTIIRGFRSITQAAADAQETYAKYNVVFKNSMDTADKAYKNLIENYRLSRQESKKMLSDTAALLYGFGLTEKEATRMSASIQTMASDLAYFTNYEGRAAGASVALTKAIYGRREMAKRLGLAITETAVKERMATLVATGYGQSTERATKALATYQIMREQAAKAYGSTARESAHYASAVDRLSAAFKNLKEKIGASFLKTSTQFVNVLAAAVGAIEKLPSGLLAAASYTAMAGTAFVAFGAAAMAASVVYDSLRRVISRHYAEQMKSTAAIHGETEAIDEEGDAVRDKVATDQAELASIKAITNALDKQTAARLANIQAINKQSAAGKLNTFPIVENSAPVASQAKQQREKTEKATKKVAPASPLPKVAKPKKQEKTPKLEKVKESGKSKKVKESVNTLKPTDFPFDNAVLDASIEKSSASHHEIRKNAVEQINAIDKNHQGLRKSLYTTTLAQWVTTRKQHEAAIKKIKRDADDALLNISTDDRLGGRLSKLRIKNQDAPTDKQTAAINKLQEKIDKKRQKVIEQAALAVENENLLYAEKNKNIRTRYRAEKGKLDKSQDYFNLSTQSEAKRNQRRLANAGFDKSKAGFTKQFEFSEPTVAPKEYYRRRNLIAQAANNDRLKIEKRFSEANIAIKQRATDLLLKQEDEYSERIKKAELYRTNALKEITKKTGAKHQRLQVLATAPGASQNDIKRFLDFENTVGKQREAVQEWFRNEEIYANRKLSESKKAIQSEYNDATIRFAEERAAVLKRLDDIELEHHRKNYAEAIGVRTANISKASTNIPPRRSFGGGENSELSEIANQRYESYVTQKENVGKSRSNAAKELLQARRVKIAKIREINNESLRNIAAETDKYNARLRELEKQAVYHPSVQNTQALIDFRKAGAHELEQKISLIEDAAYTERLIAANVFEDSKNAIISKSHNEEIAETAAHNARLAALDKQAKAVNLAQTSVTDTVADTVTDTVTDSAKDVAESIDSDTPYWLRGKDYSGKKKVKKVVQAGEDTTAWLNGRPLVNVNNEKVAKDLQEHFKKLNKDDQPSVESTRLANVRKEFDKRRSCLKESTKQELAGLQEVRKERLSQLYEQRDAALQAIDDKYGEERKRLAEIAEIDGTPQSQKTLEKFDRKIEKEQARALSPIDKAINNVDRDYYQGKNALRKGFESKSAKMAADRKAAIEGKQIELPKPEVAKRNIIRSEAEQSIIDNADEALHMSEASYKKDIMELAKEKKEAFDEVAEQYSDVLEKFTADGDDENVEKTKRKIKKEQRAVSEKFDGRHRKIKRDRDASNYDINQRKKSSLRSFDQKRKNRNLRHRVMKTRIASKRIKNKNLLSARAWLNPFSGTNIGKHTKKIGVGVGTMFAGILGPIKPLFAGITKFVGPHIKMLGGMFQLLAARAGLVTKIFTSILTKFIPFVGWAALISGAIYGLGKLFEKLPTWFAQFSAEIVPNIKKGLVKGLVAIPGIAKKIGTSVAGAVASIGKGSWDIVKQSFGAHTEGVEKYRENKLQKVYEKSNELALQLANAESSLIQIREESVRKAGALADTFVTDLRIMLARTPEEAQQLTAKRELEAQREKIEGLKKQDLVGSDGSTKIEMAQSLEQLVKEKGVGGAIEEYRAKIEEQQSQLNRFQQTRETIQREGEILNEAIKNNADSVDLGNGLTIGSREAIRSKYNEQTKRLINMSSRIKEAQDAVAKLQSDLEPLTAQNKRDEEVQREEYNYTLKEFGYLMDTRKREYADKEIADREKLNKNIANANSAEEIFAASNAYTDSLRGRIKDAENAVAGIGYEKSFDAIMGKPDENGVYSGGELQLAMEENERIKQEKEAAGNAVNQRIAEAQKENEENFQNKMNKVAGDDTLSKKEKESEEKKLRAELEEKNTEVERLERQKHDQYIKEMDKREAANISLIKRDSEILRGMNTTDILNLGELKAKMDEATQGANEKYSEHLKRELELKLARATKPEQISLYQKELEKLKDEYKNGANYERRLELEEEMYGTVEKIRELEESTADDKESVWTATTQAITKGSVESQRLENRIYQSHQDRMEKLAKESLAQEKDIARVIRETNANIQKDIYVKVE